MAMNGTTLASAMDAKTLTMNVTSATGFAVGNLIRVDGEFFVQTAAAVGTVIGVRRGQEGSAVRAHALLANVATGLPSDYPATPTGQFNLVDPVADADQVSIGANGVIAVPTRDTILTINKATALGSTTLAAPAIGNDGIRLTITSQTAAAHVITATSLINDGATGAPHTTLTFAAFKGASIVLQSQAGLWNVVSNNGITVS